MATKYIAYCEEKGVYLGHCMGMGFWSNLDSVGQTHAPWFDNEQEALDHFTQAEVETNFSLIPIEIDPITLAYSVGYVSSNELRRQGKPHWRVDES